MSTHQPRQLGSNGPRVFPIGLGCMGMSDLYGPADESEGIATIHAALDALSASSARRSEEDSQRGHLELAYTPAMYLAVLRASSSGHPTSEILARHRLTVDASWDAGELDVLGRLRADSGFNATVADAETTSDLVVLIETWLAAHEALLRDLAASGAIATLDVGVCVDPGHPNRTVRFTAGLLQRCAEAGVLLEVSAYASGISDDSADSEVG